MMITSICNDHFDFDNVDLEGRAEVIILETEYSAVSTHIVQDIWCVQNEVFYEDSLHLIADIQFRMKAVMQNGLVYDRKSK